VAKFVTMETWALRENIFTSPRDGNDDIEDDDREVAGCPYLKSLLKD
jgi:hypothetical protein